jgi:hypothetical protein
MSPFGQHEHQWNRVRTIHNAIANPRPFRVSVSPIGLVGPGCSFMTICQELRGLVVHWVYLRKLIVDGTERSP